MTNNKEVIDRCSRVPCDHPMSKTPALYGHCATKECDNYLLLCIVHNKG